MPNNLYASPTFDKETRIIMDKDGMNMAKRNRGKTINYLPSRGRGTCPLCGRTRIKLCIRLKQKQTKPSKYAKTAGLNN
jgi:hypothetical protein